MSRVPVSHCVAQPGLPCPPCPNTTATPGGSGREGEAGLRPDPTVSWPHGPTAPRPHSPKAPRPHNPTARAVRAREGGHAALADTSPIPSPTQSTHLTLLDDHVTPLSSQPHPHPTPSSSHPILIPSSSSSCPISLSFSSHPHSHPNPTPSLSPVLHPLCLVPRAAPRTPSVPHAATQAGSSHRSPTRALAHPRPPPWGEHSWSPKPQAAPQRAGWHSPGRGQSAAGAMDATGAVGAMGPMGAAGATGIVGAVGAVGAAGTVSVVGAVGAMGEMPSAVRVRGRVAVQSPRASP